MSLLIKALQQAEKSKSEAAETGTSGTTAEIKSELELAPRHEDIVSSLKEESGFDGAANAGRSKQAAAAAVFRAHQGDTGMSGVPRSVWLAGGATVVLLLLGGGFYYYLKSLEQPALTIAQPVKPLPEPRPVAIPVAEKTVAPELPVTPVPVIEPKASPDTIPAPKVAAVEETPIIKVPEVAQKTTSVQQSEPGSSVKVLRSRAPVASINDQVKAGYDAYMAGDDVAASRYYRQAVQAEPRNVDAVLGSAAVAVRQGKFDEAASLYMRVLELEPRNPSAQAGLIGLTSQADPKASETRLKELLIQQPEAAFLHAALGNLYADQGQWVSAQQAYFQAYHFDSTSAEYAFDLAVSLDQMGKHDLAFAYYQRTLELMPKQGTSVIDKQKLDARLAELRQVLNK